ncbi:carboxypeptidase regulatory-like domain-containing protein [Natronoarchaeum mannanilyticum]|uniref:CARDB domain-containing protein n=1 Tax=Natronoarchaeum mannanilyticum TaxID=926360 RepID=A0AAV3TBJ9_9EURY
MEFRGDERAVVIQIGAVLLLAALVIAMSGYQATVVPDQNNEIEFNHNQDVQGQMQELRNGIVSAPGGGSGASVRVDLGVRYPSRTFFVNPSPATGTLRTVGTTDGNVNITVDNAAASGETGQFWDGDARSFNTGALAYEPKYSEYDDAPTTIYEQSLLYNRFDDANITISEQSMVDGRQINLVALNGSLSESGTDSTSVSVRPVSTSRNAVAVEGDGSDPINVTVPTRLDNATWSDALEAEYASNGGNIVGQYYEDIPGESYALLTIELDGSKTYELRMAKVGVGSDVSEGAEDLYLTDVEGGGSVDTDGTKRVTVEVRDRYNNPVSGEQVNLTVDGDGELDNGTTTAQFVTGTSDSAGRVTVTYEAPGSETTDTVTADIDATPTASEEVEFTMDVAAGGGGGGGGSSAPADLEVTAMSPVSDPIKRGETLKIDAKITNNGGSSDGQTVKLDFAGATDLDRESVSLAPNESQTVRLRTSETEKSAGEYGYTVRTEDDDWTKDVTIEETSGPYFDVGITGTNDPVTEGDQLEVDVAVENVGDAADTQTISWDVGGDTTAGSRSVTLDPGESQRFTVAYDTEFGDAGEVDVVVEGEDTSDSQTVTIEKPDRYFDVTIRDTNSPIGAGQTLNVTTRVKNRGSTASTEDVTLDFDGIEEDVRSVTLDAGETKTIHLEYETQSDDQATDVPIEVASPDSSDSGTVDVEDPPYFDVKSVDVPTEVVEGETVEATATVENTGGPGTKAVDLDIPTVGSSSTDLTLDAGESKTVTLTYDTQDGDAGSGYDLYVRTEDKEQRKSLDILDAPYYDVTITETNRPTETETLEVTAEIYNTGQVEGTKDVFLDFDGRSGVDSRQLTIPADSTKTVTLTHDTQDGDAGDAVPIAVRSEDAVDNSTVEILELARVSGTVTDRESANDDPIRGVDVELVDGDGAVVESDTTDSTGAYAFQTPRGDYTVRFDGVPVGYDQQQTDVSLTAGEDAQVDAQLDAYSVFAYGANDLGNKDTYNAEIGVTRTDGSTLELDVYIEDTSGNNNGYNAKTVTIDGQTYTLTTDAADRMANSEKVDLIDESNYENLLNGDLDQYNGAVPQGASYTVNNHGDVELSVSIEQKR